MIKLKIKDSKLPIKEETPKRPRIKIKPSKSEAPASTATMTTGSSTRIKLVKKTPKIKLKAKRVPGDGYDSEDPDKEDDPLIEEGIILRMLPDESLDNLRYMLETGDLSDLSIRWKDSKRAVLSIRGVLYGAKLVDLPTITEVSKSIDKKNIFKTMDVCQMLLVVKKLQNANEINDVKVYEYESYPDGLTKPLVDVKSRFTKRINNLVINKVEAKVEQLLRLDQELESSKYELVDFDQTPSTTTVNTPRAISELDMANFSSLNNQVTREMVMDDGEEEIGIDLDELGEEITDDLEQELAQALVAEEDDDDDDEDDDDDDDNDDEEEDDDNEGEVRTKEVVEDNEQDDNHQHNEMIREEITELEATIKQKENDVAKAANPILRNRFTDIVNRLKQELNIKKQQLRTEVSGEGSGSNAENNEDDDEEEEEEDDDDDEEDEEDEDDDEEEDDDDEDEDGADGNDESKALFGELAETGTNEDVSGNGNNDEDDDDMEGLF